MSEGLWLDADADAAEVGASRHTHTHTNSKRERERGVFNSWGVVIKEKPVLALHGAESRWGDGACSA